MVKGTKSGKGHGVKGSSRKKAKVVRAARPTKLEQEERKAAQKAELTAVIASQVCVPKVLRARKLGHQFCCQPKAEDEDTADDSHRLEGSLKAEGS